MSKGLTGKVALVTGGAQRVGRAIALALARAGMDVAITFNMNDRLAREVVSRIENMGRRAWAIKQDLARLDPDGFVRRYRGHFERLDALVNNASVFEPSPFGQITRDFYDYTMMVNACAPLLLTQAFAPMLGAHYDPRDPSSPGRVVNFIDMHVLGEPLVGFAAYNASKAALREITVTCALELAPKVTVNAVAPGVVAWAEINTPEQREQFMARIPLARVGTPKDAAAAVLFLVRDANYCTGQIIKVDGGRLLT